MISIKWYLLNFDTAQIETVSLINPLSANLTKWPNTLKQFVGKSRRIVLVCLAIFVGLALQSTFFSCDIGLEKCRSD